MAQHRSKTQFVFRPQGVEKELSFTTRAALSFQGATGIEAITPESNPELHAMLEDVSERAGIPAPKAYVWHSNKPVANAVAISGKAPTVAFSDTILELLSNEELTAVAAHELGHVKNMNHAGKLGLLAGAGGAALGWLGTRPLKNAAHRQMAADAVAGKTSSPAGQTLLFVKDMAIFTSAMAGSALASRSEEYAADRHGAMLMQGDGTPLMSGLQKLGEYNEQNFRPTLLGKILKPYGRLTRSHPEFEKRSAALGVTQEDIAAYRAREEGLNTPPAAMEPPTESLAQENATAHGQKQYAAALAREAAEEGQWQQRVEGEAAQRAQDSAPSR